MPKSRREMRCLRCPSVNLAKVEKCCRLKARACQIYVEDGRDARSDRRIEIELEATEHEWYLWMFDKQRGYLKSERLLSIWPLYECLAAGVSMLDRYVEMTKSLYHEYGDSDEFCPQPELLHRCLEAVAAVQAQLGLALGAINLDDQDRDLHRFRRWLKEEQQRRDIRPPRIDETKSIDATAVGELLQQINELRAEMKEHCEEVYHPRTTMQAKVRRRPSVLSKI